MTSQCFNSHGGELSNFYDKHSCWLTTYDNTLEILIYSKTKYMHTMFSQVSYGHVIG